MIGREKERRQLEEAFDSEESEFVAVFGRRRIGKTFLIRETFDYSFAFQHSGIANSGLKRQLRAFAGSLMEAGGGTRKTLRDWFDAFDELKNLLRRSQERKKVVFFDEMPWMDTPKSGFVAALENFWNAWASARKDILLIVCGSATSWVVENILRNRGGLHNRVTVQIPLEPFTLRECELFAQSRNLGYERRQIVETYMALGGVPYYWKLLGRGMSPAQNIDALFFSPTAKLKLEYSELYASLFKKPAPYEAIVSALGAKGAGLVRSEIARASGIPETGTLSRRLEELEQCGFIRKYAALGRKNKGAVFQLIDNFTLFHFKIAEPLRRDGRRSWTQSVGTQIVAKWEGLAFERVCLQHIGQIKHALGIGGVAAGVAAWRGEANGEHAQVDLVIDRDDGIVNLCEMKFSSEPYALDANELRLMERRRNIFKAATGTRKAVHLTMVAAPELKRNAAACEIQSEVVLDDLFK